jgi:hypothetical protein
MTKVKYIHCFGTSHTAGGGFEFESTDPNRVSIIKKYYSDVDTPTTQFNFSYPGQLQKFLGNDIKVFNHGKQGYGNDRMYRISYDLINEHGFNTDANIFLFEFSGIGRGEYYLNKINDYITINYQHKIDENGDLTHDGADLIGVSHSYFYETEEFLNYIKENTSFYENIVKNFISYKSEYEKIFREAEFFISYLERCNINFYYTVPPIVWPQFLDENKKIIFGDGNYFEKNTSILDFSFQNDLTIKNETSNLYNDDHNSFKSNKLVAHIIYNRLIDDDIIDKDLIDIDWKWYREKKFLNLNLL